MSNGDYIDLEEVTNGTLTEELDEVTQAMIDGDIDPLDEYLEGVERWTRRYISGWHG